MDYSTNHSQHQMTFIQHHNIKQHNNYTKAYHKVNAVRTLTGTRLEQEKESSILHEQFICSTVNYVSPTRSSTLLQEDIKKLQRTQNSALTTIEGCLKTHQKPYSPDKYKSRSPTYTLDITHHSETTILQIQYHLNSMQLHLIPSILTLL